jgi:hypothetical protein
MPQPDQTNRRALSARPRSPGSGTGEAIASGVHHTGPAEPSARRRRSEEEKARSGPEEHGSDPLAGELARKPPGKCMDVEEWERGGGGGEEVAAAGTTF